MPVVINWVKKNKLSSLLILILTLFILKYLFGSVFGVSNMGSVRYGGVVGDMVAPSGGMQKSVSLTLPSRMPTFGEAAPAPDVKNRMVVSNSQLSLLVKDVGSTLNSIKKKMTDLGGYMVESSLSRPEEAASGQISLRIPSGKLEEALVFLRSLSVKVVSENLLGEDVTDQYVDNNARLVILAGNKARFEEIMKKAVEIQDILSVQQQIFSLQSQMDSIKGQQNYLAKTAQMAKVTVYLSTDELALPYSPSSPWRPEVVFKLAVRSLFGTLQGLGGNVIWIAVYSLIWLPILIAVIIIHRHIKKKKTLS